MEITLTRAELLGALKLVAALGDDRRRLVNLEAGEDGSPVRLSGRNADLSISAVLEANVLQPGAAVLPLAWALEAVEACEPSDPIRLVVQRPGRVVLLGPGVEWTFTTVDPAELAETERWDFRDFHEFSAIEIYRIAALAAFATDEESIRYALGHVLLEAEADRVIAVACDGRRLARLDVAATAIGQGLFSRAGEQQVPGGLFPRSSGRDRDVLVSVRALRLAAELAGYVDTVRIGAGETYVLLATERFTIAAAGGEGRFPRWRDVIPKDEPTLAVRFPANELLRAVRKAAVATDEDDRSLEICIGPKTWVIRAKSDKKDAAACVTAEELPTGSGEPVEICLAAQYLIELLEALGPLVVTMEVREPGGAVVFRVGDYVHVIMQRCTRS